MIRKSKVLLSQFHTWMGDFLILKYMNECLTNQSIGRILDCFCKSIRIHSIASIRRSMNPRHYKYGQFRSCMCFFGSIVSQGMACKLRKTKIKSLFDFETFIKWYGFTSNPIGWLLENTMSSAVIVWGVHIHKLTLNSDQIYHGYNTMISV